VNVVSSGVVRLSIGILLVLAAHAAADSASEERSRAHFEAGDGLYKVGNYRDAIREFAAGYALSPRPAFLINMAQSHRKLGELPKARELLQRFLAEAPPDDPTRERVTGLIGELDKAIAEAPPPPTAPTPVVVAPPPPAIVVEPLPPPRPVWKKPALWVGLAVAIVVAAGAAVAIVYLTQPRDPSPTGGSFTFQN
jgi:tetratricopeptide (TPR) repeat protein